MSNNLAVSTLSSAFNADENHDGEIVMITLNTQDLGIMTAKRYTPREFHQELLARLHNAGAPIEGSSGFLRPAHGKVLRMKTHPSGDPSLFGYLWMSDASWSRVVGYREASGFDAVTGEVRSDVTVN